MHLNPSHVIDRLPRAVRERIVPLLHQPVSDVTVAAWRVGGEPVPPALAINLDPALYQPLALGETWGPAWGTTWLRIEGRVPHALLPAGPGEPAPPTEPTQPTRPAQPARPAQLTRPAQPTQPPRPVERAHPAQFPLPVELVLDLGWFDHSVGGHCEGLVFRPDGVPVKALHPRNGWVRLTGPGAAPGVLADDGSFTLFVEAAANPLLLGLPPFVATTLGEKPGPGEPEPYRLISAGLFTFSPEIFELLRDLEATGDLLPTLDSTEPRYWQMLRAVENALDAATPAQARAALQPALARPAHASAHRMTAVGHAHIDSAWLWPLRETRRKVARTLTNVLTLMETDDEFVYAMSSAQQYQWVREDHPELFERVRQRVAEGRIVPVGGMWVESDAVMPTGESLVRQITFGKRWFAEAFGHESQLVWLPDSFGYSGAWPQIARRAGYRYFLTQKISWNDTTTFPHHTFSWEGLDGSRILTHFPPADTYAAEVTAAELKHAVSNFRDKAISSQSLLLFGYGDGGGGPNREMLSRTHRFADLEGAARVGLGHPEQFFREVEAELGDEAPLWSGELYLELHRGTLTSQIAMKQGNRRAEALLRTVEYLATVGAVRRGRSYPYDELEQAWHTVLLHQFHDILPGSSISWVHREARDTYQSLEASLRSLLPTEGESGRVADFSVVRVSSAVPPTADAVVDNGVLRAEIGANGTVTALVDVHTGRSLLVPGQELGALQLFRDQPARWDAWDLDRHVLRNPGNRITMDAPVTVTVGERDVVVTRVHGASTYVTRYSLQPGVPRLDITVEVDWQEREHLLKLSLPVAVHTRSARFEAQYGALDRPTHENTAADEAQFEVCSHRWVHVTEPGFGVGVANDSTYGCDVRRVPGGTEIRPTLLRAPHFPDPDTDRGQHVFRFAVVAGDESLTRAVADDLNAPELGHLPDTAPLVSLELASGAAVVDWIKLADDRSGDVVVRIHETLGGRATGRLVPHFETDATIETDVLERPFTREPDLPAALLDGHLTLGPYQLTTLRLTRPAAREQ
ncbi:alpha-mannosidase [Kineosporia succinea]|uniref:Alpha-mannosidase n=1 Tax=Kineosporia succinea TaxID=84632 RepID=A0ABT9P7S9_9ACTN|nr:glycoside hydrolase family 38 C-terminal domain-containing protein [Kineosporia succinea]MDP9828760.1 alpha-mannosidase [Kineosporia succinea]